MCDVLHLDVALHLLRFLLRPRPQRHLHLGLVLPSRLLRPGDQHVDLPRVPSRLCDLLRQLDGVPHLPVFATGPHLIRLVRPNVRLERVLRHGQVRLCRVLGVVRDLLRLGVRRVPVLPGGAAPHVRLVPCAE